MTVSSMDVLISIWLEQSERWITLNAGGQEIGCGDTIAEALGQAYKTAGRAEADYDCVAMHHVYYRHVYDPEAEWLQNKN